MTHKPPDFTTSKLWPSKPAHTYMTRGCMNSHEAVAKLTRQPDFQFKSAQQQKIPQPEHEAGRRQGRGCISNAHGFSPTMLQGCWRRGSAAGRSAGIL